MLHLIEVAFKGNRKEFYLWEGDQPPKVRSAVIVEADRGEDLGRVHALGQLATRRCTGCSHGCGTSQPERRALRPATTDEERRATELRGQDEEARRRAMERVKALGLIMKVSDAEWQWDRKKLTFFFTAEKRVDFRALVRDLAAAFRTRIELKQIGVRDEAKRLDGIGRCGRQYCSAGWLPELRPVNLQVAKDQRLSLNPSQISGACGRLMCCLRYEHDFYIQSRKRFPKEGRVLRTRRGEEKVIANDIFNERVTLRDPEGDTRVVLLAVLKEEIEGFAIAPEAAEEPASAASSSDSEGIATDDDEPLRRRGERAPRQVEEARAPRPVADADADSMPSPTAVPSSGASAEPPTSASAPLPAAPAAPIHPGARRRGRRGGRRGRGAGGSGTPAEG